MLVAGSKQSDLGQSGCWSVVAEGASLGCRLGAECQRHIRILAQRRVSLRRWSEQRWDGGSERRWIGGSVDGRMSNLGLWSS
ncbi:unnamed protein product [Linum trigynum]|uniref:Uncharacterized protein n=1 Tax=Linum trigynum TaxID=586398 RepID=A0AAV2FH57_9ROSI